MELEKFYGDLNVILILEKSKRKFSAIQSDGLAAPGERIKSGQAYIHKAVPNEPGGRDRDKALKAGHKSAPQTYRGAEPVIIDKVLLTHNYEDQLLIKINTRQTRRPELGDKFSSRHGQKGVCGIIIPQEDMPFSDLGICPDIIMNPHGFPSRMTVGKMIELLAGKAGVLKGEFQYGTVSLFQYFSKNIQGAKLSYSQT